MNCRMLLPTTLLLALASGSALALPPIMDRVPAGNPAVIVVPNLEQLGTDAGKVGAWTGTPEATDPYMLLNQFPGMDKIDRKGPLAVVITDLGGPGDKATAKRGELTEPRPPKGALLFQADYDAFVKTVGGKPTAGIDPVTINDKEMFTKKIDGGLVALSTEKGILETLSFAPGQLPAHTKALGARASTVADTSDLTIMVDVLKARPLIDEGFKNMEEQVEDMAAMGGQEPNTAAVKWFMDNVLNDATMATFALDLSDAGVGLHMISTFKADSPMSKIASLKGVAPGLTARLPMGPYLVAMGLDLSSPELRKLLGQIPQNETAPGAKVNAASNKLMLEKTTGSAAVIGVNPGGAMAGVLSRTFSFSLTTEPNAYLDFMRTAMTEAYEQDKIGKATFTPNAADIDGTKVESYTFKLTPNPDIPPQMMNILFGMSGGPSGYIAPMEGAVATTLGKSSEMMRAGMLAFSKGEGTFAKDKPMASTAELLPKDRLAEVFVGVKGILDTALPTVAMFTGMPLNVQIPDDLPPVGLAIAPANGSMQASIVIPAAVIKTGSSVAKAFRDAQENQNEQPEEPMEPDQKRDSGKPKF